MVEGANKIEFFDIERQIIPLLAFGYSQREVAEKVNVSYASVKSYSSKIIKKMGVKNMRQAIYKIYANGFA